MNEPKHTAAFEQVGAHLLEMASTLGRYAKELEAQGFSREETMELVRMASRIMLNPNAPLDR